MAKSTDFFCGLFAKKRTPQPTADGLRGVEFSPRSSFASSRAPPQAASAPTANQPSIELAGYYSPPAPRVQPLPGPAQDIRGYYAPEPAAFRPPNAIPRNTLYS
ncbi:hypothetical protein F4779DRAFT_579832 [Xylariaceae sp. FL0662B]|nr:hypothetical protein F4779DRAFT_579832 [Xylariaceae sp. FL0662B]